VLADAVEALGLGQRHRAGTYTSLTPMNRLADAARPESESVRELEQAVARAAEKPAAGSADGAELRVKFREWADNDSRLAPLAAGNALLAELTSISRNLSAVGAVGLEALNYFESGQAPPEFWISQQKQALAGLEKPCAEVTLAAGRPVGLLLDALERRNTQAGAPPAAGKRR